MKITAAHLAGLRPLPAPASPLGPWDRSTAFVAGFAVAILAVPELSAVFGAGEAPGAPHSAADLLVLLAVIAFFGIFPLVFLQHLYLQNVCKRPTRLARFASAAIALTLMSFATDAMKPLVGYEQKLAEDTRYAAERNPRIRSFDGSGRSPASLPAP